MTRWDKMSETRGGQPKSLETRIRMAESVRARKQQPGFSWDQVYKIRLLSIQPPYNRVGGLALLARHLELPYMKVYKIVSGARWIEEDPLIEELPVKPLESGLEVICGPMFASKTTHLQIRLKQAEAEGRKAICFKPSSDIRYAKNHIVTHSGKRREALPINDPNEVLAVMKEYDVFGFDEGQFFDDRLLPVIDTLLDHQAKVIVSGLDLDSRGVPFGILPTLLAMANQVTKLRSICTVCGKWARYSQRITVDNSRIELGSADKYAARCYEHFTPSA